MILRGFFAKKTLLFYDFFVEKSSVFLFKEKKKRLYTIKSVARIDKTLCACYTIYNIENFLKRYFYEICFERHYRRRTQLLDESY